MKKTALMLVVFIIASSFVYWSYHSIGGDSGVAEARLNDSNATPEGVERTVEGSNQFAFNLYSRLSENERGNIFISPWSIYTALAMTYEGARGKTAEEMEEVINLLSEDKLRWPSMARIQNALNDSNGCTLETANALWAQESYHFLESYFDTIREYYGGKISNLDFVNQPEGAVDSINSWVSEKTKGKIEDLIKRSMINHLTRLILTNAIYFKGNWVRQFDEDKTYDADFWVNEHESVTVPMMSMDGENAKFDYVGTDELKAIELPYEGEEVSMLVLLPKEGVGLDELEEKMCPDMLSDLSESMMEERVVLTIPKFKFETKYRLSKTMADMGMPTAFTSNADFSGMTGGKDLFIDFVVHKAFIEVNEEGSEAAAATAVGMKLTAVPSASIFNADHPFMFLIRHNETGSILFLGRITDPSA